ncbi:MAG: hypothetical protein COA49_09190 [Bacteroidetes bacterium]|nr:MAG: hypothetical protein COA49_09190 [Bacteroidota bacterium]
MTFSFENSNSELIQTNGFSTFSSLSTPRSLFSTLGNDWGDEILTISGDGDGDGDGDDDDQSDCPEGFSFCGVGTVWDPISSTCTCAPTSCLGDLNQDGFIQLADLLDLLSLYGTYCN